MKAIAPTVLDLDGVRKSFGPVVAVDGVSLAVRANEFFALLGPSGCGKTTLLRLVAGFEQPDAGAIRLDGRDITGLRPSSRPLNLMFQSYALFPHMSVAQNLAYGLECEGVRGTALRSRVAEALALVQLEALADRKPNRLSGGQRQRVALARALIKRPRLLLLDEPLAALDKKLRLQMQIELKRLQHETGITFLVVTHDQEEALGLADRIALMDHGRIVQLDTPRDLYEHPVNRFAADFIGAMNFIEGRLRADALLTGIDAPGLGFLPGDLDGQPAGPLPETATLAVRPERIHLWLDVAGTERTGLAGTVVGIAYLGQDLVVHVGLKGRDTPLVVRIGCASAEAAVLKEGSPVRCAWHGEHARILLD